MGVHTWPNGFPLWLRQSHSSVVSFKKRTPAQRGTPQSDNVQGRLAKSSLTRGEQATCVPAHNPLWVAPPFAAAASRWPRSTGMDLRHFTASGHLPAKPRKHNSKRLALAYALALQSLSSAQKPCQPKRQKCAARFYELKASLERTIRDPTIIRLGVPERNVDNDFFFLCW